MADEVSAVAGVDALEAERWGYVEDRRNVLVKIVQGLYKFARRKPLGAFGAILVVLIMFITVFGPGSVPPREVFGFGLTVPSPAPYSYKEYKLGEAQLEGPSWKHLMGTDQLGRDVFSRLMFGAGISVWIGVSVFAITTTQSTLLTLFTAYYIRSVDLIVNRLIEIFGFLPDLILIIALFSIYGATPFTMIGTLGFLGGINTSRMLRAVIIGLRGQPFIEATKSIGASDRRIILKHIFPNVAFLIIIGATGAIAGAVQIEAGLAIIGFGLDPTYPSWGNMMNSSREVLRTAPHMAIFPALFLATTIFGFRLLGDALRDVLDPRLRGGGR